MWQGDCWGGEHPQAWPGEDVVNEVFFYIVVENVVDYDMVTAECWGGELFEQQISVNFSSGMSNKSMLTFTRPLPQMGSGQHEGIVKLCCLFSNIRKGRLHFIHPQLSSLVGRCHQYFPLLQIFPPFPSLRLRRPNMSSLNIFLLLLICSFAST